ncbi:hypothetical protein VSR68_07590 [Paraburkholderia phymatum]
MDAELDSDFIVLFNGRPGVAALWNMLLRRETPHIQVVEKCPNKTVHRVLAESYVALPAKDFFCISLEQCMRRCKTLLLRARDPGIARRDRGVVAEAIPDAVDHVSAGEVLRFGARHLFNRGRRKVTALLYREEHWTLATQRFEHDQSERMLMKLGLHLEESLPTALWELDWHHLPERDDHFYADPFLWKDESGQYHLFFEELSYEENRGVISHVMLDSLGKRFIDAPKVVLRQPYHLSYPFLFQYGGAIFMIPETSANRTIEVYRASQFPITWVLHKILLDDVIAADTTLFQDGVTWWMWTSVAKHGEPNYDELSLYYADTPFGPWTPHPLNPVVSDCRSARMAGNVFRDRRNRLIRPAQDCEHSYGGAIRFCEITELTRTTYAERIWRNGEPPEGFDGVHTWNRTGDLAVIDVKRRLSRWMKPRKRLFTPSRKGHENSDLVLRPPWAGRNGNGDSARSG